MWDGAVVADNIAYHPFGAPKRWRWGNATAHARGFDADGRLATYPAGLASRTLAYDAASRITGLTDSANAALNQGYEYDGLDRLTRYLGQPANQSVAYDANGNRSSLTIGANSYAYTYATGKNRLTKTAGPAPVRNFTYDAAGNVKGDGTSTFTYDARGRMSQATRSGSTTAYAHNARGERVRKNGPLTPTGTNYFFYDEAGHLIGEYDQNGSAIAEVVWLEEIPVAVVKANEIHHVYTDQLDAPRVVLDRQNRVRWRWDAEPFGTSAPNENPAGLGAFSFNLRFPGQYFDKETNLHYNTFRDYDPATGRYVQADLIGLDGGPNLYAYANNAPTMYSDPLGMMGRAPGKSTGSESGSLQVGAGGGFHYGPGGAAAESGVAVGSNGSICFYTQVCGTVGFGLAGSLGGSVGVQTGELCSGDQDSDGVFASGGDGVYGGGQITHGSDGSAGVNRGFGGVGAGAAGGRIFCTTRYMCVNEPPSCKKKCS